MKFVGRLNKRKGMIGAGRLGSTDEHLDNMLKLHFVKGTLEIEVPWSLVEAFREATRDIPSKFDQRSGIWRCDALYYFPLTQKLSNSGYHIEDHVPLWRKVRWETPPVPLHPLRDEQKKAISDWMPTKRGVIVMPTGTGKTEVALTIMKELSVSTLVVSPVRDLMYQWHQRIYKGLGYDAGIIGDNTFNVQPISVTTYESAYIHMDKLGADFQLIIFDECHHLPSQNRSESALMSAAPFRLGLTATPERSDNRHEDLDRLIGPIVYHLPISSARGKTLAEFDIVRIPIHLSAEEQERYNVSKKCVRDFFIGKNQKEAGFDWMDFMAETSKDPEARAAQKAFYVMQSIQDRAEEKYRILEDIFSLHMGESIIVFTGSNVMARSISLRFLVPCLLNHCGKRERMEILDGFKKGVYPVIVANQVLDEGVDIPEAKVAVVVGGGSSSRQAKQRLGRILRKKDNKKGILYEVVCDETGEVKQSRARRKNDAYQGTRHIRT